MRENKEIKEKKRTKIIMGTMTVMVIIRTMKIGNSSKSIKYRKKRNKQ